MRAVLRVASFLLALVLLCSSFAGCAATVKPLNYVKDVLEKTVEKRFGGELFSVLSEALESGSVAIRYGGTDLYDTPLESGEITMYFDGDGQSLAAIGSATVGGKAYDGKLFFNAEELVLCSTAFFGSTDLGVNFSTLKNDLSNSIFSNNSTGSKYSRPEIGSDAADDAVALKDSLLSLYDSLGDLLELSDDVSDEFLSILTEYAPHSRYAEKGTIYITATVDNTVLSRALRDTRAVVIKDSDFRREARELAAIRDRLASVKSGLEVTDSSDKLEEFIASDIGVNELCNRIDAAPDFEFKLECAIDRSARMMETFNISYTVAENRMFSFAADLTDDNTNILSLAAGGAVRTLVYRVTKNGLNRYGAEMSYQKLLETGEEVLLITGTLQADRKKDAFTLTLQKGDQTRVLEGGFDKKIDGFEASVNTVAVNGEVRKFSFSLAVKTYDKAEKSPEYVNLVAIAVPQQFDPIAERATAAKNEWKTAWADTEVSIRTVLSHFLTVVGAEEEIPFLPTLKKE